MSRTDAYLTIILPGMDHWKVEEVISSSGAIMGFKLERTQVAALTLAGNGNEHKLPEVRAKLQARADALNAASEPLILPPPHE
jgi:hypothetical protein